MATRPLTDDERAVIRYVRSSDPPATEPVPQLLTQALRRIVESSNPIDALRHEIRTVVELVQRYEGEQEARDDSEA